MSGCSSGSHGTATYIKWVGRKGTDSGIDNRVIEYSIIYDSGTWVEIPRLLIASITYVGGLATPLVGKKRQSQWPSVVDPAIYNSLKTEK